MSCGLSILDVVDAENLLNNKGAFIGAMIERAKSCTTYKNNKKKI